MKTEKDYTRLQGILAICSFTCGVLIACTCLFLIEPRGEISNSGITIVSELLILSGALLGIKVGFDTKMQKFEARINNHLAAAANNNPELENNGEE